MEEVSIRLSTTEKQPLASDRQPLERSQFARRLAEKALLGLMEALRDHDLPLIVLGGLVPEVLTSGQEPPVPEHLGTTDIDIHLGLSVSHEVDLGPLERALGAISFSPDPKIDGWRWRGETESVLVKIEFLCDLDDRPANQSIRLRGCDRLTAANLRGTGFVAEDFEWEEVTADLADGELHSVRVRFAGLQGYLMSKAFAARTRGLDKDYYDFVYTLLYNRLGGPSQAAEALAGGKFSDRTNVLLDPWPELRARFVDPQDFGSASYAEGALLADPTGDVAVLRQDAIGAVTEFFEALEKRGQKPG